MKRITTATLLSAFAALALGAGCSKSDSSSTKPAPTGEARRDDGPLLPPPGPGLGGGAAGGDPAAPTTLSPADRAAIGAERRPRAWVDGEELTPEQLEARRAERREQREQRRNEVLAAHDADGDGQLSPDEREAMRQARITAMHGRVDADGDGRVSKAELEAMTGGERRPGPPFESLDADGDGFLSVEEMRRVRLQRGPRADRIRGGNGWGEQVPSGAAPGGNGAPAPQ